MRGGISEIPPIPSETRFSVSLEDLSGTEISALRTLLMEGITWSDQTEEINRFFGDLYDRLWHTDLPMVNLVFPSS